MVYLIWRRFQDHEFKDFLILCTRGTSSMCFRRAKSHRRSDVEHGVFCQSLWITSARRPETPASNTGHFKNAGNCGGQFFVPPWALEEMLNAEVMALHKLTMEVVEKRFGIFGSTARLVLRLDGKRAENDEERLVEAVQSAGALQTLKASSDIKAISKATHLLVKMHSKREFSWFDVQLSWKPPRLPVRRRLLASSLTSERSKPEYTVLHYGRFSGKLF
eukprot:s4705_g9.t1